MWSNGRPTNRIPTAVARAVRRRDGDRCVLGYEGCSGRYEELDHIVNIASSGQQRGAGWERADDLQCVCRSCHKIKTQAEARLGRARWKRSPEPHPGIIRSQQT